MKRKNYTAILFDLDDTLIDTTQYLVLPAIEKSFAKLLEQGIISSIEEARKFQKMHPELADKNLFFQALIQEHREDLTPSDRSQILDEVLSIYFGEPDPRAVKTFPEAHEVLSALAVDYDLYLVSLGKPSTQEKKVAMAGLTHFFKHAWFPDFKTHHDKEITFRTMLEITRMPPDRVLCVGNRVDHEIFNAKTLEMKTCWVEYGEHKDRRPRLHHEMPDFTIPSIRELIATCRL